MTKIVENAYVFLLLITILCNDFINAAGCGLSSRSTQESDCYLQHLARENVIKMGMDGGCDMPKPEIVYPQDTQKVYMPRGTILHRCSDHSGCCPQKEHSCQPISEEDIKVAFYAVNCGSGERRPTPEYVQMKNHTRCGCRTKMDSMSSQRLVDPICGRSSVSYPSSYYSPQSSYGQPSYGQSSYGQSSYGQQSYNLPQPQALQMQLTVGSQPGSSQKSMTPCQSSRDSSSSVPLTNGQVVRGTIRVTVDSSGRGQQQQQCPYG